MAIAFRAASTLDKPTDGTAWALPFYAGAASGDLALAFFVGNTTAITLTTPTGWTIVGTTEVSGGSDSRGYLYRRVLDGAEGATLTATYGGAGMSGAACMVGYTGVDQTNPINGAASDPFASSTTPSGPTLTPSVDNCMVVAFFGTDASATGRTWTAPTGYTERVDFQDTGPFVHLGVFEKQQTTAGAETPQPTLSTADEGVAWTVALLPAAVATTTRNRRFFLMGQRDPFMRRGR